MDEVNFAMVSDKIAEPVNEGADGTRDDATDSGVTEVVTGLIAATGRLLGHVVS